QPAPAPTLLEEFDKQKAEAKAKAETDKPAVAPADASKPTEAPSAQAAAPVQPSPVTAPFEYKYTLPETIKMADAEKAEVHSAFHTFPTNPTEGAQALVNLHEKKMQEYAKYLTDEQNRVWNETRQG